MVHYKTTNAVGMESAYPIYRGSVKLGHQSQTIQTNKMAVSTYDPAGHSTKFGDEMQVRRNLRSMTLMAPCALFQKSLWLG